MVSWDDPMRRPPRHPYGRGRGDAWAEFWSEWWRGPAPRAERGSVRYLILDTLRDQPRHGYEIIQAIIDKTNGAYRPSPGVIYPTLQMLDEMELVRSVDREGRKVYELTAKGRIDLEEHAAEVRDFYEGHEDAAYDVGAEEIGQVMKRVGALIKSFKRNARRGHLRPGKMRKILRVLDDALDQLDALLHEED
jgi:DNA-binding PadR family transcriptional regulator